MRAEICYPQRSGVLSYDQILGVNIEIIVKTCSVFRKKLIIYHSLCKAFWTSDYASCPPPYDPVLISCHCAWSWRVNIEITEIQFVSILIKTPHFRPLIANTYIMHKKATFSKGMHHLFSPRWFWLYVLFWGGLKKINENEKDII